jgi:cation transport regulator ChaB
LASVKNGVFESVADFPAEAKAAARNAFKELETRRDGDSTDETASAAVREVLSKHFPSEAPGNLGVGLLESLPSRSRAAPKPAKPVFVSDDEDSRAEALYESRRTKPSLRERLATSALASTAAERDGDGRGRGGGGGFAADPLDSWNADRGGFASYPADADEPDVGDAIVVDDEDDDDDGFEILDRFGDSPPVARARGLPPWRTACGRNRRTSGAWRARAPTAGPR